MSPGAASHLSASILCSERHSVGRNAAKSSVNHLQNSVSKHLSLTVWAFKYEHNSSVNMLIVCYSDADSALNETKQ